MKTPPKKPSQLRTMLFAKDMRVIKDSYRETYDEMEWGNVDRFEEIYEHPDGVTRVYRFK